MAAYFDALNYTLANEDTAVELAALAPHDDVVVAVAGSGARVLPLLAKAPRELVAVDLSAEQLALTELRVESLRALDHASFLGFWGYPRGGEEMGTAERRGIARDLALSSTARALAQRLFEANAYRPLLYLGRWERALKKLTTLARTVLGSSADELLALPNLDAQRAYLAHGFPWRRMQLVVGALGSAQLFNALLYRGAFPKKNVPGSRARFYLDVFKRLLERHLVRESFFLQLVFQGRLSSTTGNPLECDAAVYGAARRALAHATVSYVRGDVLTVAAAQRARAGLVSLSDVPSYLDDERARGMLQELAPGLRPGGRVVVRNYLRVPEGVERRGFVDVSGRFRDVIESERVGVYRIEVQELSGANPHRRAA